MFSKPDSVPGFACPECGHHIVTTFELLLSGQPFYCSACGLKISLDQKKSSGALEVLRTLQEGIADAERIRRGGR